MGISARQVKETDRMDKYVVTVALEDVLDTLHAVAGAAIQEQIGLGNRPTSIVVDSSGRKPITDAKRRIQAFFADTSQVIEAVQVAWQRVQELTRIRTGRARSSYELWFKESKIGNSPDAARAYADKFDPATDYFRIVGPMVVYGRVLYWSPTGTPRFRKVTVLRTKTATFKLVKIRGIMNLAEDSLRRKFRSIAIAEDWVVTNALPKDGRTPGLWIGFKRRGSLIRRS